MIKLLIAIFVIVGLVLSAPFAYREFTIWDAADPSDDDSTINEILFAFTPRVTVHDAQQSVEFNLGIPIIDIRSKEEFEMGHIPNAILIREQDLHEEFTKKFPDINTTVYVYGSSESRAGVAVRLLRNMGYVAYYINDGFEGWKKAGHKIEKINSMYF